MALNGKKILLPNSQAGALQMWSLKSVPNGSSCHKYWEMSLSLKILEFFWVLIHVEVALSTKVPPFYYPKNEWKAFKEFEMQTI